MGSGARAPGGQLRREVRGQTTLLAAAGLTVSARLGRAPATASRCAHRRPRPAAASLQPHLVCSLPPDALDTASTLPLLLWEHYCEAENAMVADASAGHEGERPRVAVSASELLAPLPHTWNARTALSSSSTCGHVRVSLGCSAVHAVRLSLTEPLRGWLFLECAAARWVGVLRRVAFNVMWAVPMW